LKQKKLVEEKKYGNYSKKLRVVTKNILLGSDYPNLEYNNRSSIEKEGELYKSLIELEIFLITWEITEETRS
jgi:hypothetical protein